jgi:hypothetical protein
MFAALSKMILFPAVIILLTVSVAIAAESSKASATTATPVYKPPKRGAPASRVGGGARGAEAGSLVLSVLAPEHTGWTAKDQPTLYWYISEPANTRVELTVIDDAAIAPLLETHLEPPSKAGVQHLRLADHNVHLKEGMEYQWSVALVRDPGQRSQDIVASGTLAYVKPSAELKQKLTQVDKEALVLLLISNARNSVSMFFEPSAHFVISPSPFNRLGVAVVVFGPCRHDVLNEFVPTAP